MDDLALGASAAMLHVPQPAPFEDHEAGQDQNQMPPHAHTGSSRGRGGRARGGRGRSGRGHGKAPDASPRPRLQRPKANMMPRTLSEILEEPKIALMHRVVNIAGPDIAWKTLMETLTIEEHGGLVVNADACGRPAHMLDAAAQHAQPRRRTKGGVFLTMLKTHVPKEVYKKIFEVEDDIKKKRKKQMRYVKHQKMESKINELPLQGLFIGGSTDATAETRHAAQHELCEEGEDGEVNEPGGDVLMADAET